MKRFAILSPEAFLCLSLLMPTAQRFQACLPSEVKPTDVVSVQSDASDNTVKKITVSQKLAELKARCKNRKLVDAAGREIYFYRLEGCWGNPPVDYQEILQRQDDQLKKLRKRYTVIEMTCNTDGIKIQ